MIAISLYYYYEKVFILMKIWMVGKNLMKHHYLKKKITDADDTHAKRICKDFAIENSGEYHDLYVQSDTLLLADVFDNFRDICINI